MKRILCLLFVLAILVFSGCVEDQEAAVRFWNEKMAGNELEKIAEDVSVRFLLHTWDGWGITAKKVEGDCAQSVVDELKKLTPTGEIEPRISDMVIDENSRNLPIEPGILWIEYEDAVYRISSDRSRISRVKTHLGQGIVLGMTDILEKRINEAWYFWPYNSYSGAYKDGELQIKHVYAAESDVDIVVKDIYIDADPKHYEPQNSITVEVIAKKDIKTKISLFCAQSSDNLHYGEEKEITLKAGIKQTLTLKFGGWSRFSFSIEVRAENTKVNIFIDPT